jgi:hypothetical protein
VVATVQEINVITMPMHVMASTNHMITSLEATRGFDMITSLEATRGFGVKTELDL